MQNGVRGLMLDMYDFNNDIWLCHSFGGKCYNFTAFVSIIYQVIRIDTVLCEFATNIDPQSSFEWFGECFL